MLETYYDLMRRQGISRRSFLKFCSLTAASLGLGDAGAQQIAQAMQTKPRTPVIWFKICPVLLTVSAALLVAASLV